MNIVLRPHLHCFCCVYLNDILMYSRTPEEHEEHLKAVLDALSEAQLYAKPSRCKFRMAAVKFLGHVVSASGIATDPEKISAMHEFPTSTAMSHVRSFLGMANYYRRFIKDFARIAAPLSNLTGKAVTFAWTAACQESFDELKRMLVSAPILQMPDPSRQFHVTTDASGFALGAVLEQDFGRGLQPVAYFSKRLSGAQLKYDPGDQEALGIVTALAEWKCYLQGSHFIVNSDHRTLQRLQHQRHISGWRARYAEFLQGYDCTVNYIKGSTNVVADALSRRPNLFAFRASSVRVTPSLAEQFRKQHSLDDFVKSDRLLGSAGKLVEHKGVFFHKAFNTVYVPKVPGQGTDLRKLLTLECHRSALSGHFGTDKVVALLQHHCYWPQMRRSVALEVECCHE